VSSVPFLKKKKKDQNSERLVGDKKPESPAENQRGDNVSYYRVGRITNTQRKKSYKQLEI